MTNLSFVEPARALLPELVALRRALHREPEVGLMLPKTQAAVVSALEGLGLELTFGSRTTSVVAVLRGAQPGPTVLLRGDMDALPIEEKTDLDFRSENGNMHSCGHDLHTAGLVGAAKLLASHRDDLHGDVLFMFQPGEESLGGAKIMLEEGLLEASGSLPIAAFALHVRPGTRGVFCSKAGPIMASSNSLYVTLKGSGGHGSSPWKVKDPIPALAELTLALENMITRRCDVFDPAVLTVTMLSGSHARNIIGETASLGATIRAVSERSLDVIEQECLTLVKGIAAAHGLEVDVVFTRHYPVTVNDEAEVAHARSAVERIFGAGKYEKAENPTMGAEDFSFVLQHVPGAFLFVGASPEGIDPETAPSNHSKDVLFDDAVLADQSALLAELAWSRLRAAVPGQAVEQDLLYSVGS
jgi:hippurate hydrolase